ncbi:MAG: hypothetical protein ACPIOQ_51520, partial [Promethearchaeia archaeon]
MVLAGLPCKKMQPDSAAMSKEGLTVLSWNLEGLAEDELDARTRVAMTEVLGLSPTIACFQEVVPRSLATVQRCLHAVYEDAERESPPSRSYFTKLYIRRGSGLTVTDVVRNPFRAGSAMGRDLVRVTLADGCGTHVCVATTHLESTAQQVAVDFDRDVRPILSNHCFACHGPDEQHREAGARRALVRERLQRRRDVRRELLLVLDLDQVPDVLV